MIATTHNTASFDSTQNRASAQAIAKNILDRSLALISLVLLLPLFAIVALAIKIESPGPVFFCQDRGGKDGNSFRIFKFRSMRNDAGLAQATRSDPRVTRVGAFLRKTSIDELPQLLNILIGHMAIVGPRPHAVAHDIEFDQQVGNYMQRYAVKPGLTGWAQVNNSRGETETHAKVAHRTALDLHYIANWSLWLDMIIIIRTPLALISTEQAY